MATQPNIQFLSGPECLCDLAGEELRVNHILQVGRVVGYSIDNSLDNFPATKNSEEAHGSWMEQLTVAPASEGGDLQKRPKRRKLPSILPRDLG